MKLEIRASKAIVAMLDTQGISYVWKQPIEQGDHDILEASFTYRRVHFFFTSQGELQDVVSCAYD